MMQAPIAPDIFALPEPRADSDKAISATKPEYSHTLFVVLALALLAILLLNIPPFLQMPLECDPVLFDLYARDMARGGVLYRDMLENNTPTMIAFHAMIRSAFGRSATALRAVDLAVVGSGIALLAGWFRPGRRDLHVLTFMLLSTLYLTTTEWCHVQRDVWLLFPVMAGMVLRRRQLHLHADGRCSFALALLEGLLWGFAVWLKPYALVVGAAVWLAGAAWAFTRGASYKTLVKDAVGLFLAGSFLGVAGIGAMHSAGIWVPYVEHLTNWGAEYHNADFYGKIGKWLYRLGYMVRNAPWSIFYVCALPAGVLLALRPILARRRRAPMGNEADDGKPDSVLLGAALVGWAFQAAFLQHIFDYPHIAGEMLAVALLVEVLAGMESIFLRRIALGALVFLSLAGYVSLFKDRAKMWGECVRFEGRPETKDRVALFARISWTELERVNQFLRSQNAGPGEVNVISDTALPLWEMLDQTPPTRYYIVQNNLFAFPSRRPEILGALAGVNRQRFLVCDITALHRDDPYDSEEGRRNNYPLREDWYGPRRWADRVVFRAGQYAVVVMKGAEIRQWLEDVTDH